MSDEADPSMIWGWCACGHPGEAHHDRTGDQVTCAVEGCPCERYRPHSL